GDDDFLSDGGAQFSVDLGEIGFAFMLRARGALIAVPPQNTSRSCPECGHVSAENRKRQAKFVRMECGFSANADFVAACNIREAGLALLACSYPSGDVSPSSGTHRRYSCVCMRPVG